MRHCFFAKKQQKTFIGADADSPTRRATQVKVFWFFFSKKNVLPFVLVLSSCNLAPTYHLPLVPVPVAFKEARVFHEARPADTLKRGAWWQIFNDPVLNTLESQVDTQNPTLAISLNTLDQARAYAAQARAGLYPNLALAGQINEDRQSNRRPTRRPGQPNQYLDNSISTQARYEVDLWQRVANSIRAGRRAAQATAADVESTRLSLHAELADDYITLRGQDAQSRVLQHAAAVYNQALQITQNRFAGKIASGIDVARARTQLENAEAASTDIAARRAVTEHAIAVLIGRQPAEFSLPPAPWPLAAPDISPGLPSTLLERRPDVASAERQMAAANATIGVTRAAFYPTLSLDILYGLQDTGFNIFSLPDDFWAIGPGLAFPLFEGGLRRAEEDAARAQFHLAEARYRATVLAAFADVEDALSQQRLLATETSQQAAALQAARQTLAMTTNLYKDGATNFLDVVVAQTEELQTEQAATDLRTRRTQAVVQMVRALGGGWNVSQLPSFRRK